MRGLGQREGRRVEHVPELLRVLGGRANLLDVAHRPAAYLPRDARVHERGGVNDLLHDLLVEVELRGEVVDVHDGRLEVCLAGLHVVLAARVVLREDHLHLAHRHGRLYVRVHDAELVGVLVIDHDIELARAFEMQRGCEDERHVGVLVALDHLGTVVGVFGRILVDDRVAHEWSAGSLTYSIEHSLDAEVASVSEVVHLARP